MFENMLKHTGMLNNTGKNVVVVFMQLPEDKEHALVIDTDALPDLYNESLRRIVESQEAQSSKNLADVLSRRMSPDGSNQTMLQKFHMANRLQKTPITNVTMVPRRGVRWPLVDVISAMETREDVPLGFNDLDAETKAEVAANLKRFNVHDSNMINENHENNASKAASLIEMAKMLEADAQVKREQAYRLDPNLMPSNKGKAKSNATVQTIATAQELPSNDLPPLQTLQNDLPVLEQSTPQVKKQPRRVKKLAA